MRRLRLKYRNRLHENIRLRYGVDRRVVFETESEYEAFDKERELIEKYGTYVYGAKYRWGANFTLGGEGCVGGRNSPETRAKMGFGRKGKKHTDKARAQMSRVRKGRKINELHRLNIQRASTCRRHTAETREGLSELAKLQHQRKMETK